LGCGDIFGRRVDFQVLLAVGFCQTDDTQIILRRAVPRPRPEVWPLFFQVDFALSILKGLCRAESEFCNTVCYRDTLIKGTDSVDHGVYLLFLSLLPLWSAVKRLQLALDVRRDAESGNEVPPSSATIRNALVMAIFGLILGIFATLQQVTKVIRRLQCKHRRVV